MCGNQAHECKGRLVKLHRCRTVDRCFESTQRLTRIVLLQVYEPVLIVGLDKFAQVDIRIRVTGGGHTSQVYAVRQALSKALIAYYQKFVDEHSKNLLKQALTQYDRTLLVADNRRCEPKKFGGKGARSRFQKSYR